MNIEALKTALTQIGISDQLYALGGHAEMSWCLEQNADGAWDVYWRERGNKLELATLRTERQACFQLLGRLTYSQLLSRKIQANNR